MSRLDCDAARERLPWLVRGTLASDERTALEVHLAGCATCRAEASDTRRALWIATRHLPSELLADYGAGLELSAWPRDLVESHLATCPECREDLALEALPAGFVERSAGSGSSSPSRRRSPLRALALAASLLAAVSIGWLSGRVAAPRAGESKPSSAPQVSSPDPVPSVGKPRASAVALLELQPESMVRRGTEDPPPALARDVPTTLVLATDRAPEPGPYRVRILTEDSTEVAVAAVEPNAEGLLLLLVPPDAWPPGHLRLELEASGPDGWRAVDSFRLEVPD